MLHIHLIKYQGYTVLPDNKFTAHYLIRNTKSRVSQYLYVMCLLVAEVGEWVEYELTSNNQSSLGNFL